MLELVKAHLRWRNSVTESSRSPRLTPPGKALTFPENLDAYGHTNTTKCLNTAEVVRWFTPPGVQSSTSQKARTSTAR
ncbi:hypothetical protein FS837_012556 [Tulasnella sp. UAMH 9824]|nr:hypothetical protein FS837_012556 [Tulasnella sp. UAMH 9824]